MTPERQETGLRELAARDAVLASLLSRLGPPPLWSRPPGFVTLVHVVLEQQVSLASARAALNRLHAVAGEVTPREIVRLGEDGLRGAGITRQKAASVVTLASMLESGVLDLGGLARLDDEAARRELRKVRGIGPWTADVYLLLALGREDVFPSSDLGVLLAVRDAYGLAARPGPPEVERIAEGWRPWRGVATRLLWHAYLSDRGRTIGP